MQPWTLADRALRRPGKTGREEIEEQDWRTPEVNPFTQQQEVVVARDCANAVIYSEKYGYTPLRKCNDVTECDQCAHDHRWRFVHEVEDVRTRHHGLCVFFTLTISTGIDKDTGEMYYRNYVTGRRLTQESVRTYKRKFLQEARKTLGERYNLTGFTTPELHKSGMLHWHGMFIGVRRDFRSCGSPTIERHCGDCDGCDLQRKWHRISGALRSHFVITKGNPGIYVSKYLTKQVLRKHWPRGPKGRRLNVADWFRGEYAPKRDATIMPAYRAAAQTLKDEGKWRLGTKDKPAAADDIYLQPSMAFLDTEFKFMKVGRTPGGAILPKPQITDELRLPVIYASKTRMRAWGDGDHTKGYARLLERLEKQFAARQTVATRTSVALAAYYQRLGRNLRRIANAKRRHDRMARQRQSMDERSLHERRAGRVLQKRLDGMDADDAGHRERQPSHTGNWHTLDATH